jgi:hypothetical protein
MTLQGVVRPGHNTTNESIGFRFIFRIHVVNEQIILPSWFFNYAISNCNERMREIQLAAAKKLVRSDE